MTQPDPTTLFPDFYVNPAIRTLAPSSRWTVSGTLGALGSQTESDSQTESARSTRKAPIDIRHLMAGCTHRCEHTGGVRGAFALDATCLVTLPELTNALPMASNTAFYLQALTDGLMVIDIEPSCPAEIAGDLLSLPGIVYSETSMSGRGYHLVTDLPANFHDFPTAAHKRVLREEHGWYEILLDHWVTFTRHPLPEHEIDRSATPNFTSVEDLYADLASRARQNPLSSPSSVRTDAEMPRIPHAEKIVATTIASCEGRTKHLEDFSGDTSRWEFSVLGSLYGWLRTATGRYAVAGITYSDTELAHLLHQAALEMLPEREKHTQTRNGRPYLLDRAAALVAERRAASQALRQR